jgi:hypothetical protein
MDSNLNLFHFVISVIYIKFFIIGSINKCVFVSFLLYGQAV